MTTRKSPKAIALATLLLLPTALHAQPPTPPTLEQILQQLDANLNRYDTRLPSLFCDEHVVSQVAPGQRGEDTITDSVFRLRRTPNPDHTTTLVESREIKKVNNKPPASQTPASQNLDGPTTLSGAFEGALAVVSLKQSACMTYDLQPINPKNPTAPYTIRFTIALTPQTTAACLLQEDSKGRAVIDPASMQIKRLELTTPVHTIVRGDAFTTPVTGKRVNNVDYAPVLLGGETFWLPATIAMRTTTGSGSFHLLVWSFRATYRNYHKMEVTSRIVPGSVASPP
jgi:hypothetical protein